MTRRLSMTEMQSMQNDLLTFAQKAHAEQGGVAHYKMLWMDVFFVFQPEMIREILVKHGRQMHRDPFVGRVFRRMLGNGVFIAEDADWKRQRRLVQPAFHAMRIREYARTMADYTQEMIDGWTAGETIDINQAFTQLTMRIIAKTMYGVDLASKTAELGRLMQIIVGVAEEQLGQTVVWPMWVPTRQNRTQGQALREVRDLLREIVRERRAAGEDQGDLLSMLLAVRDEDGRPMPEEQLLDELITLFFAGHETTAAALTWVCHTLTQHPAVAAQVTAELDDVLGGRPITFADIAELPYLDAVIKETLRLYPPAFGFGREVQEAFTVDKTTFPRKAVILFSSYATHRSPRYYDTPNQFRPDRFLDEDTHPDRYTYFPFGAGSRICLGNMFAMMEAAVILATLLQNVTLTAVDNTPVELDTVVTLKPQRPIRLQVSQRHLDRSSVA